MNYPICLSRNFCNNSLDVYSAIQFEVEKDFYHSLWEHKGESGKKKIRRSLVLHKILHGPLETWYRNYIQVTSLCLPPHKSNFVIECRNDIFAQQWLIWCTHWEEIHSNTIHDVELDLLYSLHTSSFVSGGLFKFEVRERMVVWMSEITNYGGGERRVNWLQVSRLLSKRANIRGTEGLMNAEWTYKRKLWTNTESERANKSSCARPVCFATREAERHRLRCSKILSFSQTIKKTCLTYFPPKVFFQELSVIFRLLLTPAALYNDAVSTTN